MSASSLPRFFTLNLSVLLLVVMACLSYTAFTLYEWGIEDSLTYLMAAETESWQGDKEHNRAESGDLFQVYAQWQQLPQNYRTEFKVSELESDVLATRVVGDTWLYLLPIYSEPHKQLLYVTHTYREHYENYLPGPEISDWVLLFSGAILLIALLILWRLVRPLVLSINRLAQWSQLWLEDKNSPQEQSFSFRELDMVADSVRHLATNLQQKNKQESILLRSLSHELRNPLAITQTALDRIEQQNPELPTRLNLVISKIRRANQNMCRLSESILWLWSDTEFEQTLVSVDVTGKLRQEVESNQYLLQGKQVDIQLQLQQQSLMLNDGLVTILVRNLIRNAFQYTGPGQLIIRLADEELSISNPTVTSAVLGDSNPEYGYGVGLLLVQKICQKCGWLWQVTNENGCFTARVLFIP